MNGGKRISKLYRIANAYLVLEKFLLKKLLSLHQNIITKLPFFYFSLYIKSNNLMTQSDIIKIYNRFKDKYIRLLLHSIEMLLI